MPFISVTRHLFLWHVIHFRDMPFIYVTCHFILAHAIHFCDTSFISVTCHSFLWHVIHFCDMPFISVTCHLILAHVFHFRDMSFISVTRPSVFTLHFFVQQLMSTYRNEWRVVLTWPVSIHGEDCGILLNFSAHGYALPLSKVRICNMEFGPHVGLSTIYWTFGYRGRGRKSREIGTFTQTGVKDMVKLCSSFMPKVVIDHNLFSYDPT